MLRESRLKWIKSYIARNASFFDRHTHSDARVAMAVKFLLELIPEVERLRASLRAIADGLPTSRPAATGNDDLDTAYNLQATAVAALKEPDLGPPDFVLTIYELDGRRIAAHDDEDGRMLASEVLGGPHADADAAQPTGLTIEPETEEQRQHLRRHGWIEVE